MSVNNAHNPSVADATAESAPVRRRKKVAHAAGKTANWLMITVAVCLILIAILLLIARIGVPWLANYKGELETKLSQRLGSPVVIDDLSLRWEQFGPKLSATGVSVSESTTRTITLDEALIELNVLKSISETSPVIDELTLVGANITLETSADGQFQLQGLKSTETATANPGTSADKLSWFMSTERIGLLDSTVTLLNAVNNQQLTISDLNVTAVNDADLHQLRVNMQLPAELGGAVEVGMDLVGNSDDIRNASVDVHVKATDFKIDAWRSLRAGRLDGRRLSSTGIARLDANTQIELWGTMSDGSLQSARGQILATDLVNLDTQQPVIDSINADVAFTNKPSGWQLTTDALEFYKGAEQTSVNEVVYQYNPVANTAWKLDASGSSLQLDTATKLILSLFNENADMPRARWLAKAQPKGGLTDWRASFALVDGKPDFSVSSMINDLELQAADGIPGGKRINGVLAMQNNVGKITLHGEQVELDFPSAYTKPLQLQKFNSEFDMDFRDSLSSSLAGDVVVNDFGFKSSTRVEVKLGSGASPHIFTKGQFSVDDVSRVSNYLPQRLLRPTTYDWFNQAFAAGQISNGELLMFGNVADFPFADNDGVFKVGFDFNDASLNYMTSWPQATELRGRFDVEGVSMRVLANDGLMDAMRLSSVDARIDDLFNPVLALSSTGAGPLAEIVEFGRTGPLETILSPALSDVTADGQAQMDLTLSVPLQRKPKFNTVASAQESVNKTTPVSELTVNGSLFLNNNAVSMARAQLDLKEVSGAVGFTQTGIRVNNLNALMYGRPVRIDAKTEGQDQARTTEITMVGPMNAGRVMDNYNIPLTRFVDGESHWNVSVRIPMTAEASARNGIDIAATSELIGTQLKLPEPLNKPAGTAERMVLSTTLMPESEQFEWLIDYSDVMRSLVRVNDSGLQSFSARFGGGAPNPNVDEGFRLDGSVASMGLDGWALSIAALLDDLEPSATPAPIMPVSADLRVKKLIAGRQYVGGATLRFNSDPNYINGVINNQWLSGSVRYPRVHWKQDMPALVRIATVDKRFIDALGTAPEEEDEGGGLDPRTLPPIEARIAQVRWDLLDLKDLTIRTSPMVSGLNIDTFGFAYETAQLIGDGYWRLRDPQGVNDALKDQQVTQLNLTLQGYDFGGLLTHVGFGGTLNEGEGVMSGSLKWPAAAYQPSLENMVGELEIDMKNGRILKVEPGAARLVGLFALQTLPRRLSLDFKDLVLDGLDYETIQGNVQIANGIAHAPLVQLNGSIGVLDITGESNLITEQYNQRITVLPRVSAALPIIGVISGGATAGLGVLFAGGLLKAVGVDFDRIGLREYTLTGGWDTPKLTQVPNQVAE